MAFRCSGSPLDEMKRLEKLREQDPESASNLVANGKLLVDFVRDGNLRALHCAAEHLVEGQVLIFYVVRMFREACASRRLDIVRFMLLNGFDLHQSYMRDILHSVVESVQSSQSDAVQPLIRLLLDAGVDVNWQRKSDLYTALHVACCKNLYPLAYLLVLYGADVNAIAADDSMPLSCAYNIGQTKTLTKEEQKQQELLVSFLITNQARPTWRKQPRVKMNTSNSEGAPIRPILSFSSSFGIHCTIDDSTDNDQAGLMFDTSDPSDTLENGMEQNKNTWWSFQALLLTLSELASANMSCSLIEAKFQVLDRTIKMLSKSKNLRTPRVASSEQLREMVETQKPTSLLPSIKGKEVTRSNQTHVYTDRSNRSRPNTSREEKTEKEQSQSRPSTARRSPQEYSTEKWIDPKRRRAEQLLQNTWHVPRSMLLKENVQDDRQERDTLPQEEQDQTTSNQIYESPGKQLQKFLGRPKMSASCCFILEIFSSAVHNALPQPKRPLTSAPLQPKRSKVSLNARCRSASDSQPRNWFAPSTVTETSQQAPKIKHKRCRQRPVTGIKRHHKQRINSSPSSIEDTGSKQQCPSSIPVPPKSDDPSFYMLELRLVHPEPLTNWKFQASFTDTSVNPSKTVILDALTADNENCLLFDDPQAPEGSASSRFFNPFWYFQGFNRPSDLYGHVLRIIVTSLQPVTRIVINTSVQFTHSPDEAIVEPPVQSILQHSEVAAANLVRALPRRNSKVSRKPKVPRSRKKTPRSQKNNEASTSSLAPDQCNPWTSSEQEDNSMLQQMFKLQLDEPEATVSPRTGPTAEHLDKSPRPPMATIDKKKMQLELLRANIRVRVYIDPA
ncbi:hypothetical protein P3T76_013332 [Phytophthora citrophthora]|uniref:ANK_REP_REGION domain-containing protein n=1 Tax=Phytophthora citrophthora TaxID=4793 RepID=A0AAD9G3B9_9STRA|nr:hypothetical protein P3T76_013332 [Phytophthora citrophthora]